MTSNPSDRPDATPSDPTDAPPPPPREPAPSAAGPEPGAGDAAPRGVGSVPEAVDRPVGDAPASPCTIADPAPPSEDADEPAEADEPAAEDREPVADAAPRGVGDIPPAVARPPGDAAASPGTVSGDPTLRGVSAAGGSREPVPSGPPAHHTPDETVPELAAMGRRAFGRLLRRGLRHLVRGHGPGPVPDPGAAFRELRPVFQLALAATVLGLVALGQEELTLVQGTGALLLLVGVLGAVLGFVVAAGLDSLRPAPRRHDVLEGPAADHPLPPDMRRTGLVAMPGGLHVAQQPLVFHGLSMGTRMVVVPVGTGASSDGDGRPDLVVYSPLAPNDSLIEAVKGLGRVRWIVAPNAIHHLWVGDWHQAFPDAELLAAPGLASRRPELPWHATLSGPDDEAIPVAWAEAGLRVAVVRGHPLHQEVVLLHEPTGTLVVADLFENLGHRPETDRRARRWLRLATMAERPGPPVDYKLTVDDPQALRRSLEPVRAFEVSRILLAHGRVVERHAAAVLRDGLAFADAS